METASFDLNRSIAAWRGRMQEASVSRVEILDELETHLRDSVSALQSKGLNSEEAFLVASRRLGDQEPLAKELTKVHPYEVLKGRIAWMLTGILLFFIVSDLWHIGSSLWVIVGNQWGIQSNYLGWFAAVTNLFVFVGLTATGARIATTRGDSIGDRWTMWCSHRGSLAFVICMSAIAFRLLSTALPLVMARSLDPSTLAHVYSVLGWEGAVRSMIILIAAALLVARMARRLNAPLRSMVSAFLVFIAAFGTPAISAEPSLKTIPATDSTKPAKPTFDQALQSWSQGKQEESLKQFLAVDFTQRPLFPKGSVLNYSEAEFMKLPRAVNEKLQTQLLAEVKPLGGLIRHAKSAAEAAKARGDGAQRAEVLKQIKLCGQALEHPDSLALLKAMGRMATRIAMETPETNKTAP